MSAETRLVELGLTLPAPSAGTANRVPAVRTGNLLYTSGHGPASLPDGSELRGKVGSDLSLDEGHEAGRLTGLALLLVFLSEAQAGLHVPAEFETWPMPPQPQRFWSLLLERQSFVTLNSPKEEKDKDSPQKDPEKK